MVASHNGESAEVLTGRWLRQALFGDQPHAEKPFCFDAMFNRPGSPTLPNISTTTGAAGWQAEGVTRLFAVEQLARRRGGRFDFLDVEPATANGVRVNGQFVFSGTGRLTTPVVIDGVVPCRT